MAFVGIDIAFFNRNLLSSEMNISFFAAMMADEERREKCEKPDGSDAPICRSTTHVMEEN